MRRPDSKFYKRNGELTDYALACGYIETRKNLLGEDFSLWREGRVYHVSGHDSDGNRVFWDSYDRRAAAYKRFRTMEIPPERLKLA